MKDDKWEVWGLAQRVEELEALADARDDCRGELRQLAQRLRQSVRAIDHRFARTQRWVRRCFVELEVLLDLLREQGLVDDQEHAERRLEVLARLVDEEGSADGLGVTLDRRAAEKHPAPEAVVDCESRVHVCHALCCYLAFSVGKQDVAEGIVQWDSDWPYRIARESDGKCVHLDKDTCQCTIREHRPRVCRAYDCRRDKRIWRDYGALELADWASRELARRRRPAGPSGTGAQGEGRAR